MKAIKLLPLFVLALIAFSNADLQPISSVYAGDGGVKDADCNCGPADDGDPNVGYRTANNSLILTVNDDDRYSSVREFLGKNESKNPLLDNKYIVNASMIESIKKSGLVDSLNILERK